MKLAGIKADYHIFGSAYFLLFVLEFVLFKFIYCFDINKFAKICIWSRFSAFIGVLRHQIIWIVFVFQFLDLRPLAEDLIEVCKVILWQQIVSGAPQYYLLQELNEEAVMGKEKGQTFPILCPFGQQIVVIHWDILLARYFNYRLVFFVK